MIEFISDFGRFILHVFDSTDMPAVVLLAMLLASGYAMWAAQQRPDFDWGEGFRGDGGKVSFVRVGVLVSIGVSSWVLIYITMITIKAADTATWQALDSLYKYYLTFLLVWSGTKIAERIVEVAAAKMGVTLPAAPAQTPTSTVTKVGDTTITTATGAQP